MSKLIVANWKMAPVTEAEALSLFNATQVAAKDNAQTKVAACPPFVFLEELSKKSDGSLSLGAQDVFWEDPESGGAFTGEISLLMLKGFNVSYVIVGHSERRRVLKESDEVVAKKAQLVLKEKMNLILCVGEPKEVRDQGIDAAKAYVKNQLESAFAGGATGNITVAYEPIWAIGTGTPDTPASAVEMAMFIRLLLTTNFSIQATILYGGSVKGENADGFLKEKEIEGALVGGASLRAEEFANIIHIAAQYS